MAEEIEVKKGENLGEKKTEKSEAKFVCDICQRNFKSKKALQYHRTTKLHKKRVKDSKLQKEEKPIEPKNPEPPKPEEKPKPKPEEKQNTEIKKQEEPKEKTKEEIKKQIDERVTDEVMIEGKEIPPPQPKKEEPKREPKEKTGFNKEILYYGGIALAVVAIIMIFFKTKPPIAKAPTKSSEKEPEKQPIDEHAGMHKFYTGREWIWVKNTNG